MLYGPATTERQSVQLTVKLFDKQEAKVPDITFINSPRVWYGLFVDKKYHFSTILSSLILLLSVQRSSDTGSVARLLNRYQTAKSMKQFRNNGSFGLLVSMGEGRVKEMSLEKFLKVATEMAEWTDSGGLFQRNGAQGWKVLAPEWVLTLGTGRLIPLFDLSEWDGSDAASME